MAFAPDIIKGVDALLNSERALLRVVSKAGKSKSKALLTFAAKENAATLPGKSGIVQYRVKPDITMPIRPDTMHLNNPEFPIKADLLKSKDELQLAELGNVSLRLSKQYKAAETAARNEIAEIFPGFEISLRPKSANSVYSKLERMIIKGNKTVKTDEEARQIIQDAIGGRVYLKDLTPKDVADTLNSIKIEGKPLTRAEKTLVQRLFNNEKLTQTELETAEILAKPIKSALAEKHSEPAFRHFMISGLKDALDRNITTLEKLKQSGIRKDLLQELKSNPNIRPLRMTEINNYKGVNGISYFSDRQIREFEKLQLATGERFDIITCSEKIDLSKYGLAGLPKEAKDAIKSTGYTTGQINVTLKDGTLAEIQVRGSGSFGDYQHIEYDALQEKNTLGKVFTSFRNAMKKLTKQELDEYNSTYISKNFDYYRNPELGIKSSKPTLPSKFDPILSDENMKRLYKLDEIEQAQKMKTFVPHIEYEAQSKTFVI